MGGHRLAEEKGALDVDGVVVVPLLLGLIGERQSQALTEVAGVVDQDVNAAELPQGCLNESLTVLFQSDVGLNRNRPPAHPADLFGPFLRGLQGNVGDHDVGPLPSQAPGDTASDSPRSTGDDGDPILYAHGNSFQSEG